jgi:hypothetical protein
MHQTLADVLETINQAEARNDSKLSLTFPQNRLSVEDYPNDRKRTRSIKDHHNA